MRNTVIFVFALLASTLCLGADVYPSKTVRVIVPFAAGGSVDTTARVISQQLSEQMSRQFVADNRTGASGTIGNALVAKAAPDGYTLMMADTSTAIAAGLYKSLPFDAAKDFTAIIEIMRAPQVLVVNPALNVNTIKEFIAAAQANPGKFNYGSAGAGGALHLTAELFKMAAKVNVQHIPYKGGSEAVVALIGNQTQMQISTLPTVLPGIRGGKLKALAVTTDGKRLPALPDVPSMNEMGVPGMVVYVWYGLMGPAGLPKEVVNTLYGEVLKTLAVPAIKERFAAQGAEVSGSSPEEFSRYFAVELRRWSEAVKAAGITPE